MFDITVWQAAAMLAKLLVYAGSTLAVGTVMFRLLVDRDRPVPSSRMIVFAGAVALLASIAQVFIQSGRLLDDGLAGAMDPDMWTLVAGTPLGTSVGLRVVGLSLLMVAAVRIDTSWWLAVAGVGLTALSFPMVGHARGDATWLLTALIAVHIVALSYWFGGLLPLYRAAADPGDHARAGRLAHDFGKQAVYAVAVLVLTGGWVAFTLVGSFANVFGTEYGIVLLAKLGLVTTLVALGALNKLRLVPALVRGEMSARARLRRSIGTEAIIFLLIFIATAVLTTILALPATR